MFAIVRKTSLALVLVMLVLTVLTTGVASAQSQGPETPLFPGLTWSAPVAEAGTIRVNTNGDTVSLAGERVRAQEQFAGVLAEGLLSFYSNEQLAAGGWQSYDAFHGADGAHFVFSHPSGAYLSVDYLNCPQDPGSLCVSIWKSAPGQSVPAATSAGPTNAGAFNKSTPSSNATGVDPNNVHLTWTASSGADKYAYCVQATSACADNDPDWTSSFDRDVTVSGLTADKTYYWQVRATDCDSCTPKPWTYANSDTPWKFTTSASSTVTIIGNAGASAATITYVSGSTTRTTTADSTGAYSIRVSSGWTGTVTPSKTGYTFTPPSASFTNLTASQTIQNFNATAIFTISGNTGIGAVTLSYVNGTPQTVTSAANGNYTISVPQGWTGTITPSKPAYSFTPANRSYTNLASSQTNQNFTATFITYTISGRVNVPGVTLTYLDAAGVLQFATSDASGNYAITVPQGWSGTVTPRKAGLSFSPASRNYPPLAASQTGQDYTASVCNSCADKDTAGVFRPTNGYLFLKNLNLTGFADLALNYGLSGDYPVVGDWDGDGDATIGVYRQGSFFLRNSNTIGFAEIVFPFGALGDQPIAGDWDNNGTDTIGVFRPSTAQFFLRNSNSAGAEDVSFVLGNPGDVAIAGDWNGDGTDTTGVFRPSNGVIFLKNQNTSGIADVALNYGLPGDKPVVGDWDNNGTDTIGVYRGNVFFLRNANTPGFADITFSLGNPGDMPIAGDWDNLP